MRCLLPDLLGSGIEKKRWQIGLLSDIHPNQEQEGDSYWVSDIVCLGRESTEQGLRRLEEESTVQSRTRIQHSQTASETGWAAWFLSEASIAA